MLCIQIPSKVLLPILQILHAYVWTTFNLQVTINDDHIRVSTWKKYTPYDRFTNIILSVKLYWDTSIASKMYYYVYKLTFCKWSKVSIISENVHETKHINCLKTMKNINYDISSYDKCHLCLISIWKRSLLIVTCIQCWNNRHFTISWHL